MIKFSSVIHGDIWYDNTRRDDDEDGDGLLPINSVNHGIIGMIIEQEMKMKIMMMMMMIYYQSVVLTIALFV